MANHIGNDSAADVSASDGRLAWSATVLLAIYFCWVGFVGFRHLPALVGLHAGIGIKGSLPSVVAVFGTHPWLFLLAFLAIASGLVYKEIVMKDKRRSIMVTCLLAVFFLIVVDASRILLIEPFYELFGQLS